MKRLGAWNIFWLVLAAVYFLLPLYGTAEFSLETGAGKYGFDAYKDVIEATNLQQTDFRDTFPLSLKLAIATVVLSTLLMVPTVYWVHLKLPKVRQLLDFLCALPLGEISADCHLPWAFCNCFSRVHNKRTDHCNFWSLTRPLGSLSGPQILALSYVVLGLPFTYRSLDAGMRAIDLKTLTEAGQSLGAGSLTIMWQVILPNLRFAILSSAFLTITLVMGEITMASIMLFNTFPTFMYSITTGGDAHEGAALAIISLVLTWIALLTILLLGRKSGRKDTQIAGAR